MLNKKNIGIFILVILFSIFLYLFSGENSKSRKNALKVEKGEYPLIEKTNKNYNGYVIDCFISPVTRRGFLVELSNEQKFTIYGVLGNPNYKKEYLKDNLEIGDSIFYNYKTYEFYVYKKDGKELYFKLFDSY